MNISFFQLALASVAIIFLFNGVWKFIKRERGQTFFKVLYTAIIWGGVLFFVLFPDSPRGLSIKFGFGENLNFLIFFGFILVFMAIFKLLSSIESLEQTISALIRKDALKSLKEYEDGQEE